jgi:hypothetical protein
MKIFEAKKALAPEKNGKEREKFDVDKVRQHELNE